MTMTEVFERLPKRFEGIAYLKPHGRGYTICLESLAWPGAYPIVYLDSENETLCANCARYGLNPKSDKFVCPTVDWFIHWEGESLFCGECNTEIESAYGNPWEDDNDFTYESDYEYIEGTDNAWHVT